MKLSPEVRQAALERLHRHGQSVAAVAEWLKRTHGVSVSRQAIHQLSKRARVEAQEVAQATLARHAAEVASSVGEDLGKRLEASRQIVERCEELALANPAKGVITYQRATTVYAQLVALHMKSAALDKPESSIVDGVKGLLGVALEEREREAERVIAEQDAAGSTLQ